MNRSDLLESKLYVMKTKLILLCGALTAALSLSSCDIYGYPGYSYGGYGGYGYGSPFYGSSYYNNYYSSPLLGLGSYYGGYSRPYVYSSYNRNYYSPFRSYGNVGYNRYHHYGSYGSPFVTRSNISSSFNRMPFSNNFGNRGFVGSGHGFTGANRVGSFPGLSGGGRGFSGLSHVSHSSGGGGGFSGHGFSGHGFSGGGHFGGGHHH